MHVRINLVEYEQPVYDVRENTTISELKQKIEEDVGIPRDNFVLKFDGHALDNDKTLGYYGIREGSVLDIEGNLVASARAAATRGEKYSMILQLLSELKAMAESTEGKVDAFMTDKCSPCPSSKPVTRPTSK